MAKTQINSKKNNKKRKSGPNVVAMKQKASKPNPFETIWSRRKFDILGKKRKGEEKRLGLSRSLAIDKRKKTLLKEYEQSGKASVFIDKRIGEQNDGLGEFDKALLRSQRERQMKLSKKSIYNLSDGEEDELGIGYDGNFSDRDDFEDEILPEEDFDTEATGSKRRSAIFEQDSFGKGSTEGEDNSRKSKKEVMEEIILKSKFFKAQKAKDKEENDQLADKLDKEFESLVQSEALISLTQPSKMNALKALVNKNITTGDLKKDGFSGTERKVSFELDQPDSYDKLVKEMALEMRARPSNRTKTPEEIAQEEKERLEQLEEERQKRMLSTDDSSDEEGDVCEHAKVSSQRPISVSGDDLGDSFSTEAESGTKRGWVDEILERNEAETPDSEDDESSEDAGSSEEDEEDCEEDGSVKDDGKYEKTASLKEWEQDDDDNLSTDFNEEEEEEEEPNEKEEVLEQKGHKKGKVNDVVETKKRNTDSYEKHKSSGKHPSSRQVSLPFTIEAPTTFEELCTLLENRSDEDVVEAIKRIRGYNAIGLKAENRKKMQVFYGLLLQYFAVLASKKPMNLKLLNLLVKPLMEMSGEVPYFAAICARQRILRSRMQFCDALRNSDKSCWPARKTLFLLRLWSMTFPCSDFRHVVMTPATLLMCEYLMRCPILSGRDIAIGLVLCSMVHTVTKQSQKFCPEAIMFIQTVLMAAIEQKPSSQNSQLYHLMELKAPKALLCIRDRHSEIKPLDFLMIMEMEEDSFFSSDSFRGSAMVSLIETLRGFVNVYEEYSSFPEIFMPMSELLLEVADQDNMPDVLQHKLKDVAQFITKKAQEHHMLRQPLQMRKQKPVPIKLLNPKFEENYVKGRDYDPDRERAERRKMKKLIKQEAKGAIRELRKDNQFLFAAKQKDKLLLEEERAEKYGKARAFLQEQEHAFKSGQLGKGKGKKRRR